MDWQRQSQSLASQIKSAQQSEAQARREAESLSAALPGGESPLQLTDALLGVVNTLNQNQLTNRVQLNSLTPQITSSNTNVVLADLAQPLGNGELRSLSLQVKGTYREYQGLRAYLKQVQSNPVAISAIRIAGNTFELDLKVFGVLPQ